MRAASWRRSSARVGAARRCPGLRGCTAGTGPCCPNSRGCSARVTGPCWPDSRGCSAQGTGPCHSRSQTARHCPGSWNRSARLSRSGRRARAGWSPSARSPGSPSATPLGSPACWASSAAASRGSTTRSGRAATGAALCGSESRSSSYLETWPPAVRSGARAANPSLRSRCAPPPPGWPQGAGVEPQSPASQGAASSASARRPAMHLRVAANSSPALAC
mmetsp:Transcript_55815/g.173497  ORF Transcript_55815/g.173497 Transcript_55815/m.173497 type:complete len:219 (-) Transcript_55815:181-837(-)